MSWTFSGAFLDGFPSERVVAGTGDAEELPGRYALAGLVDAHAHPTVAVDERGPYLSDGEYGTARLEEYATAGVTVIRDAGGHSQVTIGFAGTAVAGRCPRRSRRLQEPICGSPLTHMCRSLCNSSCRRSFWEALR